MAFAVAVWPLLRPARDLAAVPSDRATGPACLSSGAPVVPRMLRSAQRCAADPRATSQGNKWQYRSRLCGAARRALHRVRDTGGLCSRRRAVICPSGGLLTGVSSFISDFPKNISVPIYPETLLELSPSHPTRGAYHDRHETRGGMRWTRQRFARDGIAGRASVRERSTASGREMLQRTAKSCGPDAPTLASSSRMLCRPYRA